MKNVTADPAMAITIDNASKGTSYATGTEIWSASTPMKCMLQIPIPIALALARIQRPRLRRDDAMTLPAKSSATYEATDAIRIDSPTMNGL
jgi:hypothetical protein